MSIIFIIFAFFSGYFLGKGRKGQNEYNLYKKTNGLFEPVKRS